MTYDYIFVVLVYRNTSDLLELIESIEQHIINYKIIIVNAYYDERSLSAVREIANSNNCELLEIENKGYSFGNNVGIQWAVNHYDYKYIVIANPDTVIKKFEFKPRNAAEIIAPSIETLAGKKQNPMMAKWSKLSSNLIYKGFKNNNNIYFRMGVIINRVLREGFTLVNRIKKNEEVPIYCAHGSFLLISRKAIDNLGKKPYDENMFLFGEEAVLAYKGNKLNVRTIYTKNIEILHKEDGSMRIAKISTLEEMRKSNIYFYENYIKVKM